MIGKEMFWYIVGFFAFIVSLLSLWVNASAFGMEEDGTPQSEYEKMLAPQLKSLPLIDLQPLCYGANIQKSR